MAASRSALRVVLLLLFVALAAQVSADHLVQQPEENTTGTATSAGHDPVLQPAREVFTLEGSLNGQLKPSDGLGAGHHPRQGKPIPSIPHGSSYKPHIIYYQPNSYNYQQNSHNYPPNRDNYEPKGHKNQTTVNQINGLRAGHHSGQEKPTPPFPHGSNYQPHTFYYQPNSYNYQPNSHNYQPNGHNYQPISNVTSEVRADHRPQQGKPIQPFPHGSSYQPHTYYYQPNSYNYQPDSHNYPTGSHNFQSEYHNNQTTLNQMAPTINQTETAVNKTATSIIQRWGLRAGHHPAQGKLVPSFQRKPLLSFRRGSSYQPQSFYYQPNSYNYQPNSNNYQPNGHNYQPFINQISGLRAGHRPQGKPLRSFPRSSSYLAHSLYYQPNSYNYQPNSHNYQPNGHNYQPFSNITSEIRAGHRPRQGKPLQPFPHGSSYRPHTYYYQPNSYDYQPNGSNYQPFVNQTSGLRAGHRPRQGKHLRPSLHVSSYQPHTYYYQPNSYNYQPNGNKYEPFVNQTSGLRAGHHQRQGKPLQPPPNGSNYEPHNLYYQPNSYNYQSNSHNYPPNSYNNQSNAQNYQTAINQIAQTINQTDPTINETATTIN